MPNGGESFLIEFEEPFRGDFLRMAKEFFESGAAHFEATPQVLNRTFNAALSRNPLIDGWFLYAAGTIAGYALLARTWSNELGGPIVWLDEFFIERRFRGRGQGSWFLHLLCEEYWGRAAYMRLEVADGDGVAAKLYADKGFERLDYQQMIKKL